MKSEKILELAENCDKIVPLVSFFSKSWQNGLIQFSHSNFQRVSRISGHFRIVAVLAIRPVNLRGNSGIIDTI